MSFLKSYYHSVTSFVIGDDDDDGSIDKNIDKENIENEFSDNKTQSESWLSGIYYDAYNNSGEMWKAMKTDLTEFACVLSKDAKVSVIRTAKEVKQGLLGSDDDVNNKDLDYSHSKTSKIKASINRILDQVSKTLYIPPDSDDDDLYYNNVIGSQTVFLSIDLRIAHLQSDRNTFITDPLSSELDVDLGDFTVWKEKLNMDDFQATIADLVKHNQRVLDNFTELVPDKVNFEEFWARYFYRVASLKAQESRHEAIKLRISADDNDIRNAELDDWDEATDIVESSCTLPSSMVTLDSEITDIVDISQLESNHSNTYYSDNKLEITEKDDAIVVNHIERSAKHGDECIGWDDDDDDGDIVVKVSVEELQLATNYPDNELMESQWEEYT